VVGEHSGLPALGVQKAAIDQVGHHSLNGFTAGNEVHRNQEAVVFA
jgi:hypothetical protein